MYVNYHSHIWHLQHILFVLLKGYYIIISILACFVCFGKIINTLVVKYLNMRPISLSRMNISENMINCYLKVTTNMYILVLFFMLHAINTIEIDKVWLVCILSKELKNNTENLVGEVVLNLRIKDQYLKNCLTYTWIIF